MVNINVFYSYFSLNNIKAVFTSSFLLGISRSEYNLILGTMNYPMFGHVLVLMSDTDNK